MRGTEKFILRFRATYVIIYQMKKLLLVSFLLFLGAISSTADNSVKVNFSQPANLPYFLGQPEINVDSDEYDTLIIKIRSKKNGAARLFWASSYDPQFNQAKSLWFNLDRSAGFKDYYFYIPSQNPNWIGYIPQIAVYPEGGPAGVEIAGAEALHGNLLTNIYSGWREFWGPKGRIETGSSVNLTSGSQVFGRSIYQYLYWGLAIFFFSAWGLGRSLSLAGRQTLLAALGCWLLLAFNADLNYLNLFKANYAKYAGKTLEQKHQLAYGKDYYDFLVFAEAKLPRQPVQFSLISSKYAADLAARIRLVPHILVNKPADYVLVFEPAAEQLTPYRNYTLAAKLNELSYILKK